MFVKSNNSVMASAEDQLRTSNAWIPYKSMWHPISVPAKTILLKEGSVSKRLFKIIKGALRVWFNHDGKEISFQFFMEGEVVCSVESFRKQVPSQFYIETIEPCELRWISNEDLAIVWHKTVF
jgi:CRP-like cAMP-binding protein